MGQSFELRVPFAPEGGESLGPLLAEFHATHDRVYGHHSPDTSVEILALRAVHLYQLPTPPPDPPAARRSPRQSPIEPVGRSSASSSGYVDAPVYGRAGLAAGARVRGPAIVDQEDTTTVVYPRPDRLASTRAGSSSSTRMRSRAMDATATIGQTASQAADPVTLQVVNQRLQSIADEMQTVLCRSAFSSIIKEAQDASAGLFDRDGNAIAQAAALPGHLGTLGPAVKRVLSVFPIHEMSPGDVFCFNDPYQGGTHLPDFTVIIPVFSGGEVVALSVTMAHHQDVGGAAPGSTPPNVTEIFAEGIRLPACSALRQGRAEPGRPGDPEAQLANARTFSRAICAPSWRPETSVAAGWRPCSRSTGGTRCSRCSATSSITRSDSPGWRSRPFRTAGMPSRTSSITTASSWTARSRSGPPSRSAVPAFRVDFTGTGAQAKGPMNSVEASTLSAVYYVVRTLAGAAVPNNQGVYRPVEVYAPPGHDRQSRTPGPGGLPDPYDEADGRRAAWRTGASAPGQAARRHPPVRWP